MAFPVGAAIAGGASILGGLLGGKGAKKAAETQAQSGERAIAELARQYDQSRADLAPWREAGGQAIQGGLAMLMPGYDHTTSPGYQFRQDEGLRGIENSAAARGTLLSGGNLKDIMRFSDGLAAGDFNDNFNRHMAIASGGQQAATSGAALGQNMANNAAGIMQGIGNARASGYMGQSNAMTGMFGNLAQIAMMPGVFGK